MFHAQDIRLQLMRIIVVAYIPLVFGGLTFFVYYCVVFLFVTIAVVFIASSIKQKNQSVNWGISVIHFSFLSLFGI